MLRNGQGMGRHVLWRRRLFRIRGGEMVVLTFFEFIFIEEAARWPALTE